MKLYNYLNEMLSKVDIEDAAYGIQKNCSQILKVYKKRWDAKVNRPFLFRGVNERKTILKKKSHIKSRRPMSTGVRMHEWLNTQFVKKFGWPVRNGVASSGERNQAGTYGNVYIFFPINNYKFVWSRSQHDLWSNIEKHMPQLNHKDSTLEIPPKYGVEKDQFKDSIEPLLFGYIDIDIDNAIESGVEVFVNTPEYYLLNPYSQEGGEEIMHELGLSGHLYETI